MGWSFRNDKPIYLQIVEKLERDILSGKLPCGTKLPSVRDLALEAEVNPNTMQRALQELEARELAITQRTSGRTVTQNEEAISRARKRVAEICTARFLEEMKSLGFSLEEIQHILEEWNP